MDDLISRKAAIEAVNNAFDRETLLTGFVRSIAVRVIRDMPSAQPDRAIIDDCLHHIYKNISVHTATGGVITIKHYMQVLYEEIYGEGERPWWMT